MISEILVIGNNILSGTLVDNNTAYIARKLKEKGVEVARHSAIGNDPADIINILEEISQRSNIAGDAAFRHALSQQSRGRDSLLSF